VRDHAFPRGKLGRAIRTERYRLVEWRNPKDPISDAVYELYDYDTDPHETMQPAIRSLPNNLPANSPPTQNRGANRKRSPGRSHRLRDQISSGTPAELSQKDVPLVSFGETCLYSVPMPTMTEILDHLARPAYVPIKMRALARKLGVSKSGRKSFESQLDALAEQGKIQRTENGRVFLPGTARGDDLIAGTIKRTMRGDGWLIPDRTASEEFDEASAAPPRLVPDIFVEGEQLADAQNGDRVLVRLISRRRGGGQRCGRVEQVIERATHTFVGTYFEEDDRGCVRVDGGRFTDPVSVGDPGAKGAVPGDKVVIDVVRFPTHRESGEAVLTKLLGPRGEAGVDLQAIIHEFGLPDEFPEAVLEEAHEQADGFDESELDGRVDLTGEPIVTIDPVDARDFDDAISLKRTDDGHWHLGVHIADVGHFVPAGGELDAEAQRRGTSVYLPGRVIPMLPETISNSLASLQQGKVRFTKSVLIEFTAEGTPIHTEFQNSAIKVSRRFAYEQVMPVIEDPEQFRGRISAKVRQLLSWMHELAMVLRGRRFEAGSLELYLPEVKVELDQDGRVCGASEVVHDESHQIIEEFMLAANCAVATELHDRRIRFLRRTHGSPSPVKLKAFAQFVASLAFKLDSYNSRFDLQELLNRVKGKPFEQAVNFALLRSMKAAEYSATVEGHYALAVENYCHFTSPIRRYPDLTVHRILDDIFAGRKKTLGLSESDAVRLGTHCSTTERRAATAERELTRVKLLMFLEKKSGEVLDAVITGIEKFGIFCRCQQYPVDGFVHISKLGNGEFLDYDRPTMTITGRGSGRKFRLGDRVKVRVAVVNPDERVLEWELVESRGRSSRKGKSDKRADKGPVPEPKRGQDNFEQRKKTSRQPGRRKRRR
jgi:ribonuclease R